MSKEMNANINFIEQSINATLIATLPPYERYFPLYNPLEPSSPYTCPLSKPPFE